MITLIRENPYANTLNFQAYPHGNYTWRQSLFDWKWEGLPFCQAANTTIAIYNHFQICQSQQKQAIIQEEVKCVEGEGKIWTISQAILRGTSHHFLHH